jgi:hypothetical protein
MKAIRRPVFDPLVGHISTVTVESTSGRVRNKLRSAFWCFCELCWRTTEFATALEAQTVFKRGRNGNAKAVAFSQAVQDEAQREADLLVERYERALTGAYGPYEAAQLRHDYCDIVDMRGDRSVAAFRDQVERRMRLDAWARRGDVWSTIRLPGHAEGQPKPSKFHCEMHNPRRNEEARRAYQRDRRLAVEYNAYIAEYWEVKAGTVPAWDIEEQRRGRKVAYERLLFDKDTDLVIDSLMSQGCTNQAEIARHLGITRQAVSVSIKRRAAKANVQGNY